MSARLRGNGDQLAAAYKYPREVEVVTALPRTATGKILRRRLRGHRDPGR